MLNIQAPLNNLILKPVVIKDRLSTAQRISEEAKGSYTSDVTDDFIGKAIAKYWFVAQIFQFAIFTPKMAKICCS